MIKEAKHESRYPIGQNNLVFGFLDEAIVDQLGENCSWKDRTSAVEAIESRLNTILQSEKKVDFLPYSTSFLGFIIQFISDINFKISLTTVKMIAKLLCINNINFKKYYTQLVTALIEKLADSKVVIRHSVMKCCSLLIAQSKNSQFAFQAMRYLQHGNWHVREGALSLIAHCLLVTTQKDDTPLQMNPSLFKDLCMMLKLEDKQKIQDNIIDVFSLVIETSFERNKTQNLVMKVMVEKELAHVFQTVLDRLQKG